MDFGDLEFYIDNILSDQCDSIELLNALIERAISNKFDSFSWKLFELILGTEETKQLRDAYAKSGETGFRKEGDRLVRDEAQSLRGKSRNRLKELTSISTRGSLWEKVALINRTERLLDSVVNTEDLLQVAFAYKFVDMIPRAAKRAGVVVDLIVKDATSTEAESYLEEACYCYFYGLNSACAITCRSVLEEVIERKLPPRVLLEWRQRNKSEQGAEPTLGVLVSLSKRATHRMEWHLPPSAYKPIDDVLTIGNRAAHSAPVSNADAAKCLRAARKAVNEILR